MGLPPWKYDITRILMQTEGPFRPIEHRRGPRHRHVPLPFSGLIHDSYKVHRVTRQQKQATEPHNPDTLASPPPEQP
jgi:hypothetical protein